MLERLADLVGGPALDVAQRDDRPLRAGSSSIAACDHAARVSPASSALLRSRAQLPAGARPVAGAARSSAARKRSGSTAGSSLRPARERGERDAARLAHAARLARLARIRKIQVFSDERPSKRSRPLQHAEPRLLHDLLGDRAAGDVRHRRPQQRG